ncbi:MAG: hypothetical protein ACI9MR_001211 [Myxococcota bacterium]|jgi:hypothetical protein
MKTRWIALCVAMISTTAAGPGAAQTPTTPPAKPDVVTPADAANPVVPPDTAKPNTPLVPKAPPAAPIPKAPPTPPPVAPARDTAPIAPPDGVFEARLVGGKVDLTLTLTCAAGFIVRAEVTPTGQKAPVVSLRPSVRPNSTLVQLIGRGDAGSVRLEARFFDQDRGEGTFTGTWQRRQAAGAFTLERR